MVSFVRLGTLAARPVDRPLGGPPKAVFPGAPSSGTVHGRPQTLLAVAPSAVAGDPCAAASSVGVAVAGPIPLAALAPVVPIQVPLRPLSGVAPRAPACVAPNPLPGPPRLASRAGAGRVGARPRPIGGVGEAPSALEGRALPGHAVRYGQPTVAVRPARPIASCAGGRALQVRVVPAVKATVEALAALTKRPAAA